MRVTGEEVCTYAWFGDMRGMCVEERARQRERREGDGEKKEIKGDRENAPD